MPLTNSGIEIRPIPEHGNQPILEHEIQPISELATSSGIEIHSILTLWKIFTLERFTPKKFYLSPVPVQFGAVLFHPGGGSHSAGFLPPNKGSVVTTFFHRSRDGTFLQSRALTIQLEKPFFSLLEQSCYIVIRKTIPGARTLTLCWENSPAGIEL